MTVTVTATIWMWILVPQSLREVFYKLMFNFVVVILVFYLELGLGVIVVGQIVEWKLDHVVCVSFIIYICIKHFGYFSVLKFSICVTLAW